MEQHGLLEQAARLKDLCVEHSLDVAVAESLTAGLIGATIASITGASAFFAGGVICYDARIKESLLGVRAAVIEEEGVVSRACAEAMADGVRALCATRASIAVTGEAGPDASSTQPVGTVWVACRCDDLLVSRHYLFEGDREAIRVQTVDVALTLLCETILSHPSGTV